MKLTIQQLANICNHSWELQSTVGFHMQNPQNFRKYINELTDAQLRNFMEHLGLLFSTIERMGQSDVELKAEGHPSLFAPLAKTQTAQACGSTEALVTPPPVPAETKE